MNTGDAALDLAAVAKRSAAERLPMNDQRYELPHWMSARSNVELNGRRRLDALPAWRRIDNGSHAGKVASRWRSV